MINKTISHIIKFKQNPILASSFGILIITLCAKLFGYVEKVVLAYYWGTNYQVDSYLLIFNIIFSIFLLSKEIIEPGYLNVFLNHKTLNEDTQAWGLFNYLFRLIIIVTVILSLIGIFFPKEVVGIFAPGFSGDKQLLAINMVRIGLPVIIFYAASTITNITLNGLKIFILPASGDLAFKVCIIISALLLYNYFGIYSLIIGLMIGAAAKLSIHFIILYDKLSFKFVSISHSSKNKIWFLTWPLLIGASFSQISSLIDNMFASYLQEGSIAALSYAKKIVDLPVIIFPYILGIVVFPYFSQLAIEKNQKRLSYLFSESIRWIVIGFIPLSIFFIIYSSQIIEIIFQRGAFDVNSNLLTSKPLSIYSLGMLFFAIETILVIFYYANADTKTPIFVGIGCVILHVTLAYILIQYIGYIGIALAFVAQKTIKNIILLLLLKRKIQFKNSEPLLFLSRLILPVVVLTISFLLLKISIFNVYHINLITKILLLGGIFAVCGGIYLIILFFMGGLKKKVVEIT